MPQCRRICFCKRRWSCKRLTGACIQAKFNATLGGLQAYYQGPITTVFWSEQFFSDVNASLNAQLQYQTTDPYNNSDAATTLYVSYSPCACTTSSTELTLC